MAISDKMIARGKSVGIAPDDNETPKSFRQRVRKGESAPEGGGKAAVAPAASNSGWRRF